LIFNLAGQLPELSKYIIALLYCIEKTALAVLSKFVGTIIDNLKGVMKKGCIFMFILSILMLCSACGG
jgi:hypothetical protein